ncbi:MAG: right-handed parallel beta-helix repeat-containing protein [Planctomycetota bacterium]|nr:right-handed parallel beta-helix repeat-containing protein [Planctomycetota bacterium]
MRKLAASLVLGLACAAGFAGEEPAAPEATRAGVLQLVKDALAAGKRPGFEMELGSQRVKAKLVQADAAQATVNASGLTMPLPWEKLSDAQLFQLGLDLAGEDAAARRRMAAFALGAGLEREAQRTLSTLLEQNPRDAEALKLLSAAEAKAKEQAEPAAAPAQPAPAPSTPAPAAAIPQVPGPFAAHCFVAPNGSDQHPGTFERPFGTLQHALGQAKPGQTICLRGGTYRLTAITQFKGGGQPGAYVEVRSYPGEVPLLDAEALPGSDPTWRFSKAGYWRIRGPIHLTNGRGAGVFVDHDSTHLEFELIESSYNGKTAERGGHGFMVQGPEISEILFKNCDAHHNANHKTKPGESVEANIYQHGDGWRIFNGTRVKLLGCRAWHNLDDGYDTTQATEPIELVECWAAYSGLDDAKGSITGKPNWGIRRYDGDGIKLGYKDDSGPHVAIRCIAWANFSHGWNVAGGPYKLIHCAAYNNAEDAFFGIKLKANEVRNTFAFGNRVGNGTWAQDAAATTVSEADFASVNDAGMLGPRQADGSLPETNFLRPAPGGRLVDAGVDAGQPFKGRGPDIGPREQ